MMKCEFVGCDAEVFPIELSTHLFFFFKLQCYFGKQYVVNHRGNCDVICCGYLSHLSAVQSKQEQQWIDRQ